MKESVFAVEIYLLEHLNYLLYNMFSVKDLMDEWEWLKLDSFYIKHLTKYGTLT